MKCNNCKKKNAVGYTKGVKYKYWWCLLCYERVGKYPDSAYHSSRSLKKLYA